MDGSADTPAGPSRLIRAAPPAGSLEEQVALATLEQRLFDKPSEFRLDRYLLGRPIGTGAAGLVFKAWDPVLDRKVAIKLIRADSRGSGEQLLREARALASLSSHNIVQVFDAGRYDKADLLMAPPSTEVSFPDRGVFLVMELLEGGTLRQHLAQKSWSELLSLLLRAGEGLALAHENGIVHRDFKPENVLLGPEGRVCVVDFGLAIRRGEGERAEVYGGTPPFMSPEQHRGEVPTPLSDQYSLAVSIYLACYADYPFPAEPDEMVDAKERGSIPRPGHPLPRRAHMVLERALQPVPDDRFPSTQAFVTAMRKASRPRLRPALLAGAVALAGIGVAFAQRDGDACRSAGAQVEHVWNQDSSDAVRAALLASPSPQGSQAWTVVKTEFDRYAEEWSEASKTACQETHVDEVESRPYFELRSECLDQALAEFDSTIELLSEADGPVVRQAATIARDLTDVDLCSDRSALYDHIITPADPDDRVRARELRHRLATARRLRLVSRYPDATVEANEVREAAATMAFPPLEAEAMLEAGLIAKDQGAYGRSRTSLLATVRKAEASHHDRIAAIAWIELIWVAGVEMQHGDEAEVWDGLAQAAVERVGQPADLVARLEHTRGGLAYARGDAMDAIDHYNRALELQQAEHGREHPIVARTHNHLANAYIMGERPRLALDHAQYSLRLREQAFGSEHPIVQASLNNVATIQLGQDEPEAALSSLSRRGFDPGPEEVNRQLLLTWTYRRLGDLPRALEHAQIHRLLRAHHRQVGTVGIDATIAEVKRGLMGDASE